MILEEVINKLLRDTSDLILGNSGYMVKAKQIGAPRPIGGYGAVEMVSDTGIGWEQHTLANEVTPGLDITETIEGVREIMMSVSFYRGGAIDNSRSVRTGFVRESVQSLFRAAGLGLGSRSEVREISETLEDGWEEKAQFDIVLHAVGTDTDLIRSILTVDIAGEFQSRGLKYNFIIGVQ